MSESQTLSSILNTQAFLVQAAADALPHQFSQCTYPLGSIRQAVYLCLTCREPRGICSACSIACHTDHEQLELFPKRNFRCDCPTKAIAHPCTLHTTLEEENTGNVYSQNFHSVFCRCGRRYDAQRERETMIQCLACEDWFHESCLNLMERPPSREVTPDLEDQPENQINDSASEGSSSGLPPPLIRAEDYDSLVCSACVRSISTLRRYAGTPGTLMVARDSPQEPWKVIGRDTAEEYDIEDQHSETEGEPSTGEKRARSPASANGPDAKRTRMSSEPSSSTPCFAPTANPLAQYILSGCKNYSDDAGLKETVGRDLGAGDVFMTDDWRERWCKCPSCLSSLQVHPYLLEEEETYEPPEDPDSGLSLEELGLRALARLPRERAIEGIRAFNEMRDNLMSHLRPFAAEGKEVTEADIRAFFEEHVQTAEQKG